MEGDMISPWGRRSAVVAAVALFLAGSAAPAEARLAPSGPAVELRSAAGSAPHGRTVFIDVIASCPERWTVLRAVVTISQRQTSRVRFLRLHNEHPVQRP
jgi:hypothetical protein